jgi:rhamnogalacturonyl hydrolase YesR
MRHRWLAISAGILVTLGAGGAGPPLAARATASPDYLEAARATARYLRALAIEDRTTGALSWPVSDRNPRPATGMDVGAAGIGTFFLSLYEVTGDTDDLVTAERASDYVFAQYRRSGPAGSDWLAGAAGGGEFALRLYDATGRSAHLSDAVWAADWLVAHATASGPGYYWASGSPNVFVGRYHGPAGIGLFLLRVYAATGEARYREVAIGAARWMEQHTVRFASDAIGWKRLTQDQAAYHHWCGGSTGIMEFLAALWKATNDEHYPALLRQTAEGLARSAITEGDGEVAWTYTSANRGNPPVIFCHGSSSAAVALYDAWLTIGDPRYLDLARRAAAWTARVGLSTATEDERYWPHIYGWDHYETGYQTGTAAVGHAMVMLHARDRNEAYLQRAREGAAYLWRIADRPADGQMRWINYTNPEQPGDPREFNSGWYAGAAGVGIFMLELHQASAGAGRAPAR